MVGLFSPIHPPIVKGDRKDSFSDRGRVEKNLPAQNCSCTKPQKLVKSANKNIEYLGSQGSEIWAVGLCHCDKHLHDVFGVREDKRNLMLAG